MWIRAAAASIGNGSLPHRIFQAPLVLSPTSHRNMLRTELSTSQLCTPSLLLTEQPAALCLTFSLASKRQTVPRSSTPLRFGVPDRQQAARLHQAARSKVNCSCGMCFQLHHSWLPARSHSSTPGGFGVGDRLVAIRQRQVLCNENCSCITLELCNPDFSCRLQHVGPLQQPKSLRHMPFA